jgi:hypothetical protein
MFFVPVVVAFLVTEIADELVKRARERHLVEKIDYEKRSFRLIRGAYNNHPRITVEKSERLLATAGLKILK